MTVPNPGIHPSSLPAPQPAKPAPVAEATPAAEPLLPTTPLILKVEPWPDPVIDKLGHDPRSKYVETFWLGILGPSTTWLMRRLADRFDHEPEGFTLNLSVTAGELGLGRKGGRHSPFMRSIDRCCQFTMAHRTDDTLRVRRRVAPLTQGQVNRLPENLQAQHLLWRQGQLASANGNPAGEPSEQEIKARRLALTLLEIGEPFEAAERQLDAWRLSGPLAHRALHWAQDRHRSAQMAAVAMSDGAA